MHRSIGKKILAVVAGVGLAGGALVSTAPAVMAEQEKVVCGTASASNDDMGQAQLQAGLAASEACKAAGFATEGREVVGMTQSGSSWTATVDAYYWKDVKPDDSPDCVGDLCPIIEAALAPTPPPPPCWSNNNCPVGGAIQVAVPEYMIAGVPQQLVVYAAWRPDENTAGAPTNGDAVISMDGEPVAAAPFTDGKATFSFTPKEAGLKDVVISGVLNSNTSGANAWIDSVDASTMVLPYDPELIEEALKNKKVEVGDTYTLEEVAQAKIALGKRLEWRVAQDSKDVCAVTTTKKGEVRAKFTESGKCSIIWTDPKKDEEGKYTFKVTA